jgi:hypothetical protein
MKSLLSVFTMAICLLTANAHASLVHKLPQGADHLTVFIFQSPRGLNWDSPTKIAQTTVKNYLTPGDRNIGHVAVEFNCHASDQGPAQYALTGMTDNGMNAFKSLLIKRDGFYILFDNFPGKLENPEDLKNEINKKFKRGRLASVTYMISSQTCQRLARYLREFKENKFDSWYGLPNRPRHGEGAGCSAFGKSFVEVAGLYTAEHEKNWGYSLRFPEKLVGGPLGGKKVRLSKILFRKHRWAKSHEPHFFLKFWDPDPMYKWIHRKAQTYFNANQTAEFKVKRIHRTFHLLYDKRDVPTPVDPIWRY